MRSAKYDMTYKGTKRDFSKLPQFSLNIPLPEEGQATSADIVIVVGSLWTALSEVTKSIVL